MDTYSRIDGDREMTLRRLEKCECCGRKAELNEDGECASCKADLEYSIEDYMRSKKVKEHENRRN